MQFRDIRPDPGRGDLGPPVRCTIPATMDPIKLSLSRQIHQSFEIPEDEVLQTLSIPPDPALGDLSLPVFRWAKARKTPPPALAQEFAKALEGSALIEKIEVKGPYLNFFLSGAEVAQQVLPPILEAPSQVGSQPARGETIVLDFSSPNVAKPFHIGHLTTTVLGNSLKRILSHAGYQVEGVNHLGDWGTQFGKSAVAFQRWGSQAELEAADQRGEGARYLVSLYVRFHEEAEGDAKQPLEDEARAWFRELEEGSESHRELWQTFIEVSLREFQRVYDLLGVDFEHTTGESFYNDLIPPAVQRLEDKGLLEVSDGAEIVDLGEKIPPFLVRKSDGATLYATRDLAAAFYRLETFAPAKVLYVVGAPQKLHFRQLFEVLEKVEPSSKGKFEHVSFAHTRFKGRAIKTRAGDVIYLEDVLQEAKDLVEEKLAASREEKGDYLQEDSEKVAWRIAVTSLVFGNLKSDRNKDVIFDWDTAFEFQGDTGPGVQYGHAQLRSILRRAGEAQGNPDFSLLTHPAEKRLALDLARFGEVVDAAARTRKPHFIAVHLLELRRKVNSYLREPDLPKIKDLTGDLRASRLALVQATAEVLKTGLHLLGLEASDQM